MDRRDFLKALCALMGGFLAVAMGWPLVSSIVMPFYEERKKDFAKVPGFGDLPEQTPTRLTFKNTDKDGFLKAEASHDIWVVKHSSSEASVFSPWCTHLHCQYSWESDRVKFVCPCHGSVFNEDGKVFSGPAPRPLDTLPYKIESGELYVKWIEFRPGIDQKVEIG